MTFGGIFIISIVIPAYNEEKTLRKNLLEIIKSLENFD
jgi:glycosyltransferase involved in cell wall biosynthesis